MVGFVYEKHRPETMLFYFKIS